MKYRILDVPDITTFPQTKKQLIENTEKKIESIQKSDIEEDKQICILLKKALDWLKSNSFLLKKLSDEHYYRLGFSCQIIENEEKEIFNVQIWKKYLEDIDIQEKIVVSNCPEDLDNDNDTTIIN